MSANNCETGGRLPVCGKCCHYFVTHEAARPHGCRAMGFKSRENPAAVVWAASGQHCQLFRARPVKAPNEERE